MARRLILVAGNVASGKTTLAKALAKLKNWIFLDKDDVGERLLRALMAHETGNPFDRDSEVYGSTGRPISYKDFMRTCKSILKASSVTLVATAPFTVELHDPLWVEKLRAWCQKNDVELHLIWVTCESDERQERLIARGAERDASKLLAWEAWLASLYSVPPLPDIQVFDNGDSIDFKAEVKALAQAITERA